MRRRSLVVLVFVGFVCTPLVSPIAAREPFVEFLRGLQRRGLGEQGPRPEGEREPRVSQFPRRVRGNDVEQGKTVDTIGMIERHAIRDAPAAVVTRNRELHVSHGLTRLRVGPDTPRRRHDAVQPA